MIAFPDGSINSYAYLQGEKVAADSTFITKDQSATEGGAAVPSVTGEDVFGTAVPATPAVGSDEGAETPQGAAGGDILDGFNFDDW